jgi:hypothetical protein
VSTQAEEGEPIWATHLRLDPLPTLLASGNRAIYHFARRDLLREDPGPVEPLWELPVAQRILKKQQEDGSWRYPGRNRQIYTETNYDLLETFRQLGLLIEKFALDRRHHAVEKAASYLFSCQSVEGDIRGILGSQYMPYYHGAILELLIKAGYGDDARVERGLQWLLSVRQDNGGWIVPVQAVPPKEKTRELWSAPPVPPDRSRPFSHLATGMALRPFAVQPDYRHLGSVALAARRLKSRFFLPDKYNDRKAPAYWLKFQYPFWWTNLLTALDTLSLLGYGPDDEDVKSGLDWFLDNQQNDGLWRTSYEQSSRAEPSPREREAMLWVGLAVARVFVRLQGNRQVGHLA